MKMSLCKSLWVIFLVFFKYKLKTLVNTKVINVVLTYVESIYTKSNLTPKKVYINWILTDLWKVQVNTSYFVNLANIKGYCAS